MSPPLRALRDLVPSGRWIPLALGALALLAGVLIAGEALARPGGGGNYSGGGGGGGGGGGDGLGWLLVWLIFRHPEIGIPVTIIVIVVGVVKRARNPDRTTAKAVSRLEQAAAPDLGALGGLKSRDPAFDEAAFLERVRGMQSAFNEAWCRGDMTPVRGMLSDGLMRRFQTQLAIMKHQGVRNAMADHQITSLAIHAAEHDEHFDTLHVALGASARDVEVDAKLDYDEALARARKAPVERYAEIWSFLRRPGARTLDQGADRGSCPSCGAPHEGGQTTRCEYCDALINSGDHDWVLAEITQPMEWRPTSRGRVPGLAGLAANDAGFNRQAAEDRASYLFWRWVEALVTGTSGPLAKVATGQLKAAVAEQVEGGPHAHYKIAVGGVDLVACEGGGDDGRDRFHVKVLWSSARAPGAAPLPSNHVLSLSRASGVETTGGLSYARCPSCKGQLGENDTPTCDYCGADLSAGETDWVLSAVSRPEELVLSAPAAAPLLAPPDMGNRQERVLLLTRMAAVVMADGVVTKEERKLLKNAARRWQVPVDAVEPILNGEVEPEVAMTMRPSDPERFVSGLVVAALVDGRIDRKEEKLLLDVGDSLGLGPDRVRSMMKELTAARRTA